MLSEIKIASCEVEERILAPGERGHSSASPRMEIRHVQAGAGIWQVGLRTHRLIGGDVLLVPRDLREILKADATHGLQLGVISVPAEWSRSSPFRHFAPKMRAGFWRNRRLSNELAMTIRDCLKEKNQEQPGWEEYVESQARIFFVKFHRFLQTQNGSLAPSHRRGMVQGTLRHRVSEYIRSLDPLSGEPDTIETAAEKLAISPRRFTDLFREITGMSRLEYVHTQRLQRAKELLLSRRASIEQAAYQVGFEDLTTFYRVFRRREGMTPGDWRDRHLSA